MIAQWRALGVDVRVVVTDPDALPRARAMLSERLDALDQACSRFRCDSEVVRLDSAAGQPVPVSPLLAHAVAVALDAAAQTDGDVDPTLGSQLAELGYDRDFAQLPADGPAVRITVSRQARWTDVRLDLERSLLAVPEGVRLDLGATAKAWAADRAAQELSVALSSGPSAAGHDVGVLVSLGGDVAVAGPAPDGGWPSAVADGGLDAPPAIAIRTGGVATSGTTARRWMRGGDLLHHVLDPRTGLPARTPWRTVTVAAPTCLAANVASTATIVRGDAGLERLQASGFAARLVSQDGAVTVLGGWPADQS